MARIKVKHLSTGKTGTIEESEFDPNLFSKADGVSQPTTDTGRIKVRHRATGVVGTVDASEFNLGDFEALEIDKVPEFKKYTKFIPIAGAALGGIIGGLPTAGVASAPGAAVGYGAGYAMQRALEGLLGAKTPPPGQQLLEQGGGMLGSYGAASTLNALAGIAKIPGAGGRLAGKVSKGSTMPVQDVNKQVLARREEIFKNIPVEKRGEVMRNILTEIGGRGNTPMVQPPGVIGEPGVPSGINPQDLFQAKQLIGKMGFEPGGATTLARPGYQSASNILRDILIQETPATMSNFSTAQRQIQLMSLLRNMPKEVIRTIPRAIGYGAVGYGAAKGAQGVSELAGE